MDLVSIFNLGDTALLRHMHVVGYRLAHLAREGGGVLGAASPRR